MRSMLVFATTAAACGGGPPAPPTAPDAPSARPSSATQTHVRHGVTLEVTNEDAALPAATLTDMVECFFAVYPVMSARFNPGSRRTVSLVIDPDRPGVAGVASGVITVSGTWMKSRPNDIDVITHESFHVVQAYPPGQPGWIVEGLADYARDRYGLHNARGGWSLPNLTPAHKHTDSYRVTARFFKWLEARVQPGILEALDTRMRAGAYDDRFWVEQTGATVDALWERYTVDAAL